MQKKKAISLIVLVITIIVMIILAGAIIITLSNNGIINRASDAVEKTDQATVDQIAQLGWAEAYAENETSEDKVTGDALLVKLKAGVKDALRKNNIDPEECGIIVTTEGVDAQKGWLQSGNIVVKGQRTVEVGNFIVYDETKGGTITGLTPTDWQILGANEKGELLILSTENVVENFSLGGSEDNKDLAGAQEDWLYIETKLANECKPYAAGKNATGARSIKVEDINKVRGEDSAESWKEGNDRADEYGAKAYIYYNGSISPSYEVTNGVTGNLTEHTNGFHYYNGKTFVREYEELTKKTGLITTIKNGGYMSSNDTSMTGYREATIMFYGSNDFTGKALKNYWLANSRVALEGGFIGYSVLMVASQAEESLYAWEFPVALWDSEGNNTQGISGVRAVVSLDSKTNLKEFTATGWTY